MIINKKEKIIATGLAFDDVLLVPRYSDILPKECQTKTLLTSSITLNIPLMSAAMDTVTESALAISIARLGGIGIIHKNMTMERQAEEVSKVKRTEGTIINNPITLFEDAIVNDALILMKKNKIGGIPIINQKRKLIGIVTNRDLRFEKNLQKPIIEVMTKENLITAPENTTLKEAENIFHTHGIEKLPLVDQLGILVSMITYRDILNLQNHPFASKDDFGNLRVGAAVGVTSDILIRVENLVKAGVDVICVDTAHGHSKGVLEAVKLIKKNFKKLPIIGGNITNQEGAEALIKAGVDAVKVGIGPGSICTTRIISGVGVPQLSAIMMVEKICHKYGIPVIADGGIKQSGDIAKALAAGANVVMIGSLFAGTDEAPGEVISREGRKFKSYRGMGSLEAMQEKNNSRDRYFQDQKEDVQKLVPEGVSSLVPYKGNLEEVVTMLLGGVKSAMGYTGSKNIKELQTTKFIQITNAGLKESHPHDVIITKEAPNYFY